MTIHKASIYIVVYNISLCNLFLSIRRFPSLSEYFMPSSKNHPSIFSNFKAVCSFSNSISNRQGSLFWSSLNPYEMHTNQSRLEIRISRNILNGKKLQLNTTASHVTGSKVTDCIFTVIWIFLHEKSFDYDSLGSERNL